MRCSDILRKKKFDTYSEFYLALVIAKELGRRGHQLDMSDMLIDKNILSKDILSYFKILISSGMIYIGDVKKVDEKCNSDLDVNTSSFEKEFDVFEDKGDCLYWSCDWAQVTYQVNRNLIMLDNMGNVLMHVVGYYLVKRYLGEISKKLFIDIDSKKARSSYIYVNIYSLLKTLDWFKDYVDLEVDFHGYVVDLDYSLFCNDGYMANKYKLWSMQEKVGFLNEYGIVPGSIVILWTRKGMCTSNPWGKIESAIVARVDEIGTDFIAMTTSALNKTKEELELDYYSIPEENRHLFSDILTRDPYTSNISVGLSELGIGNYFLDEGRIITLIDKSAKITKRVTINGKSSDVEMSEIDALYWLMCQYGFDFDRNLYKQMYSGGKELLWDKYGADYPEI